VTQEQVESQLSAMFDGELPAAECELLSRRIDRDENLRARWSRYALIGAAMRSEPVATARRGFAARVSAALGENENADAKRRPARGASRRRTLWNTALAASMVTAVAGVSIGMLRYSAPSASGAALTRAVMRPVESTIATPAVASSATAPGLVSASLVPVDMRNPTPRSGEPRSYVTPPLNQPASNFGLRTELADFIVAHSEYSTPLMRRSLLSALVSSEEIAEPAAANAAQAGSARAGQGNAAQATGTTGR
jgi:negative regulator of sigma E activity